MNLEEGANVVYRSFRVVFETAVMSLIAYSATGLFLDEKNMI